MDGAKHKFEDNLPKVGKVHEMCREWLVREDGAFAYQLQSQEINDHYKHNKHKNAQVREDFPCALDEQIREQQLAEEAAAIYHKMLAEQEEIDNQMARELAERIEKEERNRRRALEQQDAGLASQLATDFIRGDIKQGSDRSPHKLVQKMTIPNLPAKPNKKHIRCVY